MSNFKPTKEQERIFTFIKKRPENILIEAFAGGGKTTSIVKAVELLPKDKNIMFLAFNKHIQTELKDKLPEHVRCYTSHGLGLAAIKRKYGDKIKMDEFKLDKIIKKISPRWNLKKDFKTQEEIYIYLNNIKKLANLAKLSLTLDPKYMRFLAEKHSIDIEGQRDLKRVLKVLDMSQQDVSTFDFTDMIFMPATDKSIWLFPQDYVVVDECLPYNTYISTLDGKMKIGVLYKMYVNNKNLPKLTTFNENSKKFETKKIEKIWCTGKKNTYYIMLNGKRKLISTENHKFLTLNGWKRLDNLKKGDVLLSNYNEQPYHKIFDDALYDITYGLILGDGHIDKISDYIYRIKTIHGVKQKAYIKWLSNKFKVNLEFIKKNGYSQKNAYSFKTKSFYSKINLKDKQEVIKKITLKSFAIMWMDDGYLSNKYNSSKLYSTATSYNDSLLLSEVINKNWNIKSQIKKGYSSSTKKEYYWLLFNKENTIKISKLLSKYIHPSMDYKLIPEDHNKFNDNLWYINTTYDNLGCMIVTNEMKFHKYEYTYDMTVKDNHNFIVTSSTFDKKIKAKDYGIITHNCQDMNRCQIRLIEKMLKKDKRTKKYKGRLIAVGDKFQSIYSFAGTSGNSFDWFRKFPNTKILPLSYSFRCSKAVIKEANKIVPDIKALETAPEGFVGTGSAINDATDGDFVLCRTTKPLVALFFNLLIQRKKAVIKGSDIGKDLVNMIGDIKTLSELETFWKEELARFKLHLKKSGVLAPTEHSSYITMSDKVETLNFIAQFSNTIPELKETINTIFTDELDGIILSTIHKAKGLEAKRVFIIRPDLLPLPQARKGWEFVQEKNLEYVAITRAKEELYYDVSWSDDELNDRDENNNGIDVDID